MNVKKDQNEIQSVALFRTRIQFEDLLLTMYATEKKAKRKTEQNERKSKGNEKISGIKMGLPTLGMEESGKEKNNIDYYCYYIPFSDHLH